MKKGISTIIAVVLLLLITIGIVWSVYNFLTGATGTVTKGAGSAIEKKTEILQTDFSIVAAGCTSSTCEVSISNTGTKTITLSNVKVYVEGIEKATGSGTLDPGETGKISWAGSTADCGKTVRVAYAGVTKESVLCS